MICVLKMKSALSLSCSLIESRPIGEQYEIKATGGRKQNGNYIAKHGSSPAGMV